MRQFLLTRCNLEEIVLPQNRRRSEKTFLINHFYTVHQMLWPLEKKDQLLDISKNFEASINELGVLD